MSAFQDSELQLLSELRKRNAVRQVTGQEAAWNRFKEGGRRNRTVPKGIIKYLNCGFSSGEGHGPIKKIDI